MRTFARAVAEFAFCARTRLTRLFNPFTFGASSDSHTRTEEWVSYAVDIIIERDAEGWYVGLVPALRGCHTQARSVDQLLDRVCEAAELCLEVAGELPSEYGIVVIGRVMRA